MAKKSPNPTDKHVGTRIRIARLNAGMSQSVLAEGLGVSFQQVQKYENGVNRVGASRLQQIAAKLGLSEAFFFEGAPGASLNGVRSKPSAGDADIATITELLRSSDGMKLAHAYLRLTQRSRRSIVQVVENLVDAETIQQKAA